MQSLIDIDYKTLIRSFTLKISKYENFKILEYSENIILEEFTTKYEDYKIIFQ